MEAIQHFARQSMKKNVPDLRPGDTVRVHQRIREGNKTRIQIFEGIILAVRGGKSINSSYVVRYVHKGTRVGVEKTFPLHSPNVEKIERIKTSKVRQARLFYLRERFGRMARMKGEVRNLEDWVEPTDTPEAEVAQPEVEETEVETDKEPEVTMVVDEEQVNATDLEPVSAEVVTDSEERSLEEPSTESQE